MGTARDMTILGVDAGGTFTDFVCIDAGAEASFRIYKTLSTPEAPERAILAGIRGLGLTGKLDSGDLHVIHGSTVATNAVLEGKVAKTVFITNHGFKDMLRLARQARPDPAVAEHAAAVDHKPGHIRVRRVPRRGALHDGARPLQQHGALRTRDEARGPVPVPVLRVRPATPDPLRPLPLLQPEQPHLEPAPFAP